MFIIYNVKKIIDKIDSGKIFKTNFLIIEKQGNDKYLVYIMNDRLAKSNESIRTRCELIELLDYKGYNYENNVTDNDFLGGIAMEFKIVKNDEKVKILSNGFYEFGEIKREGYSLYRINKVNDMKYLPEINVKENLDTGSLEGVYIQTTSYGSMKVEEIEKIIEGYQIAIETVAVLEKIYLINK